MIQSLIFKLALFGIYKGLDGTRFIVLRKHSALITPHPKIEILFNHKEYGAFEHQKNSRFLYAQD